MFGRHNTVEFAERSFYVLTSALDDSEPAVVRSEVFCEGRLLHAFEFKVEFDEEIWLERFVVRQQRAALALLRRRLKKF